MDETNVIERRGFKRVDFSEPVQFQVRDKVSYGGCLSRDISESGICVNFEEFITVGTEMILQITMDIEQVIECSGHVVWVRKLPFMDRYQIGLHFYEGESLLESRRKIHRYMRNLSKEK